MRYIQLPYSAVCTLPQLQEICSVFRVLVHFETLWFPMHFTHYEVGLARVLRTVAEPLTNKALGMTRTG